MIASMLNAIGGPLWMSIFATGKIRNYQIATSIAYLSDIVIVYLLFLAGFPPVTAVVVKVFIKAVIIIVRIFYCKKAILFFSSGQFLKNVLVPLTISTVLSVLFGYVAFYYAHTLFMKLGATFLTVLFSIAISYAIGLNKNEKKTITNLLFNYLKKK